MLRTWLALIPIAFLSATGCKSSGGSGPVDATSDALHQAALQASTEYRSIVGVGRSMVQAINVFDSGKPRTLAEYRNKLAEQAGPHHFRNEQLLDVRDRLTPDRPQFHGLRRQMTNPNFQRSRRGLLEGGGESPGFIGSLGKFVGAKWPFSSRPDEREAQLAEETVLQQILPPRD